MERFAEYTNEEKTEVSIVHYKMRDAMLRLAAYEDTGLTPEEIMDGKMLTGWIPVEERKPVSNERVLMYRPCMAEADTGPISVQWGWAHKDASHWMPLPERPAT